MCKESATADDIRAATPHPVAGSAADPIALEPVDDVVVTPSIGPTVHALTELAPDLLVPGHCTGWRAQHTLAAALPDNWVQGSSGTRYQLTASLPRLTSG
jgi:hypothetical protein